MATPSPPRILHHASEIADAYDAVLCDVWGVIHDGVEAFPAACAALVELNRRAPVVLISNAPRPAADVVAQLQALDVPAAAWSGFVTSGDATRAALEVRAPGPAWAIGPDRDRALYAGLDLHFAGPHAATFVCCTGLVDDEVDTPEQYRETLAIAAARGLEMICANPDRVVQRGERLIWCAGSLADLYSELGGAVIMAGKPAAPIYELALSQARALIAGPLARERVLCIGDGLLTDVAGANAQGLDLLYIAEGVNAAEALDHGRLDPVRLSAFLNAAGACARYAMGALA